jgi:hypothetical protein
MFQVFQTHITSVSFGCCKIDLDVAYVTMVIHACFKRMFQMSHLFQMYVASVSSACFKSRFGRAHVAMAPVTVGQRPAAATCY